MMERLSTLGKEAFPDGFEFHHIGMVVREFGPAIEFFRSLGYQCSEPCGDERQQVETVWCSSPTMPPLELIRPASPDSPAATILNRYDESIYHWCFAVRDITAAEAWLIAECSARLVRSASPAVRFAQRLVAFYYVAGAGLIELVMEE